MKRLRKIIFFAFLAITLAITAFAFWYFSHPLSEEERAKAFPENSFKILKNSDKLMLYALNPVSKTQSAEDFRGFPVITKTEVKTKTHQNLLKRSLLKSMIGETVKNECFKPRHALRLSDGKQTLDVLISFECGKFISYFEDKKGENRISRSAELLFNQTLMNADQKQ